MSQTSKVLTLPGLTHYDERIKDYIDDKSVPSNVRYVQCTGTNDQVVIQEALDELTSTGGTVYVCGACGLSDTDVTQNAGQSGIYSPVMAVIKIPAGVTLDFQNCPRIEWQLSEGSTKNCTIFSLLPKSRMQNITTFIDSDDQTYDSMQEIANYFILTGHDCQVSNIRTGDIVTNGSNGKIYLGNNSSINKVKIDCIQDRYSSGTIFLKAGNYCTISDIEIDAYIPVPNNESVSNYTLIQTGTYSTVKNCTVKSIEGNPGQLAVISLGNFSNFMNNKIYQSSNVKVNTGGRCVVGYNLFQSIACDNNYSTLISLGIASTAESNIINAITLSDQSTVIKGTSSKVSVLNNIVNVTGLENTNDYAYATVIDIAAGSSAINNNITLPTVANRNKAPKFYIICFMASDISAYFSDNIITLLTELDIDIDLESIGGGIRKNNIIDGVIDTPDATDGARGSQWFTGTDMSGTSATTDAYSYAGASNVLVGDYYLNTTYGYVYRCTIAGSGTTAKWTYQGNIKGATGSKGDKGDTGDSADISGILAVFDSVLTDKLPADIDMIEGTLYIDSSTASSCVGKTFFATAAYNWYDNISTTPGSGTSKTWNLYNSDGSSPMAIMEGEKAIIKFVDSSRAFILLKG